MNHDNPECLACCKGAPPFFACRNKQCICHKVAHELAVSTPSQLSHRDPVANKAIGNVMKGRNK